MILSLTNTKIQILKPTPITDDNGDTAIKYEVWKETWCDITRATLREYREGNSLEQGKDKLIFLIGYMNSRGITRDMAIGLDGHIYEITNLERDYEHHDYTRVTGMELEE
jgi:head-tail adaptor